MPKNPIAEARPLDRQFLGDAAEVGRPLVIEASCFVFGRRMGEIAARARLT